MAKILKIVTTLFVVVVISVSVVIFTVDINQYKGELIQLVEESTGRTLKVDGDLEFAVSLIPTVVVEDVQFSNARWSSKPDMLKLKKFEIEVALLPLLTGNIQVNRVILVAPEVLLETNKKGTANWDFSTTKSNKKTKTADTGKTSAPGIVVNEVHIENATVTYIDGAAGKTTTLFIDEITTESDSVDAPLSLIMKLAYNDIPVEVKGSLGSLNQLTGNKHYPLDLEIDVSDVKTKLKGEIAKPMDGKGLAIDINVAMDSLANLSKLVGSELPEFGPISLNAKLSDGAGAYSLKKITLKASNTDLSGDVTIAVLGKRPAITANLNSSLIDLAELSGDAKPAKKEKSDRVFSTDPLALEALNAVNVNLKLNAIKIKTSGMVLADTNVSLIIKDGNLSIKPVSSSIAGGKLIGNIGLNASGKTAAIVSKLTITGLQPNQVPALEDKITGGKTDIDLDIKGNGNSVSQIMAGLNGKLVFKMAEGVSSDSISGALGADMLKKTFDMLNPTSKSSDGTQLLCAVVNLDIKDGIATADQGIAISTSQMDVIGSGTINLKTEALDIGIKPQAKEGVGLSAGQLAGLVRVGGTMAHPKATADAVAVLTTGVTATTALATGGLSLLAQGLLGRSTADADPCATALGKKTTSTTKPTADKDASTSDKAVDAVKDAGSVETDTIKGFFN
jgi:AsmA family protein